MKMATTLSALLIVLAVLAIACGGPTPPPTPVPSHAVITISDWNMYEAISRALNKTPRESITAGKLATIQMLRVSVPPPMIHCVSDAESGKEHCELEWRPTNPEPTDLSVLPLLTNLTHLTLIGTNVSDISPLEGLTRLRKLDLRGNPINDFSPLVANGGLGLGDQVLLGDKNFDLCDGSEGLQIIKQLEARGVEVYVHGGRC